MSHLSHRRAARGFTLIELLVVVGIIAILAAIAITMLAGQRHKAEDVEAKALVRSAATAVEAANVDLRDFTSVTDGMITAIDGGLVLVATDPRAVDEEVRFAADGARGYVVETDSASGTTFRWTRDSGEVIRTCFEGEAPDEPTCTW